MVIEIRVSQAVCHRAPKNKGKKGGFPSCAPTLETMKLRLLSLVVQWGWLRRLQAWWRRQSPVRQDRYAVIAPVATVVLFVAVVALLMSYLRMEESDREQASIQRDLDYTRNQLKEHLEDRKDQLRQLAQKISLNGLRTTEFLAKAKALATITPEFMNILWVDERSHVHSAYLAPSAQTMGWSASIKGNSQSVMTQLYPRVARERQALYSLPYWGPDGRSLVQLQVPLIRANGKSSGVLLSELSLDSLLQNTVPSEILKKYGVAFVGAKHQKLAGVLKLNAFSDSNSWSWVPGVKARHEHVADFDLNNSERTDVEGDGAVQLILQGYRTSQGFTATALRFLVIALSLLIIWMLIANWRHTRRRLRTQDALIAETNFRRAMENSMPTGMRALDMEGRITYVNAAFCEMTQWRETDLIDCMPPYVYWPPEDVDRLSERLQRELRREVVLTGVEMQVLKRNGTRFTARMYTSPLIDARGQQTGWMSSITDITEPRRIREELEASYDRFTTILEGLDASISVSSLGSRQLLFANKTYRDWFGHDSMQQPHFDSLMLDPQADQSLQEGGHEQVDGVRKLSEGGLESAPSESREVFLEATEKSPHRWLEVRVRYLNWVDGHLAQMVIANDVTVRKEAEAAAKAQEERAQTASRLIMMGEMASSVAHELNQPLAAITNYCSGISSRLRHQQVNEEDLLQAIEKMSKQAQRAGQVIHRIRSFVTRSAPNRVLSDVSVMVTEAIELVGIEVQRRRIQLTHRIAADLPALWVDPILIEQVVVNLIKNAAEAIDSGGGDYSPRDISKRVIHVRVRQKALEIHGSAQRGIECSVEDTGKGIAEEVIAKIFDSFFSTKMEGMGIGLNLCRSIIESHHGRLTAQNLYNGALIRGCRFSFWLPLDASLLSVA